MFTYIHRLDLFRNSSSPNNGLVDKRWREETDVAGCLDQTNSFRKRKQKADGELLMASL
jgi:hypothetical protein